MKRIIIAVITVFAFLANACQNVAEIESVKNESANVCLRATRESVKAPGSRSIVSTESGHEGEFSWSASDAVSVYTSGGDWVELTTTGPSGTPSSCDFTGTVSGSVDKVAVFPSALNPSLAGTALTVTLPDTYTWAAGETNNFMIARLTLDATSASFKNIGAVIWITLKDVPVSAEKFVFTTPGKNITGSFTISDYTASGATVAAVDGLDKNTITYNLPARAVVQDMTFTVPVPVGTYHFSFYAEDGSSNRLFFFDGTTDNTVGRATLLQMSSLSGIYGSGTELDPYVIYDVAGLKKMSSLLNAGSSTYYKLGADIDMDGVAWTSVNSDVDTKIYFDGNNKTISNFTTSSVADRSFFGVLVGECKNVTFSSASVTLASAAPAATGIIADTLGKASANFTSRLTGVHLSGSIDATSVAIADYVETNSIGGFAGLVADKLNVSGCSVDIHIDGPGTSGFTESTERPAGITKKDQNIGGMFGWVEANVTIDNSTAAGRIVNYGKVAAGFIARVKNWKNVTITDSQNSASVYGGNQISGFIGKGDVGMATIEDCSNTGDIIGMLSWGDDQIGTICGYVHHITMRRTSSNSKVGWVGGSQGGLVGKIGAESNTISDCYCIFKNSPSGYNSVGGIVGEATSDVSITNCYVSAAKLEARQKAAGGIIGITTGKSGVSTSVEKCIVDIDEIAKTVASGKAAADQGSAGAIIGTVQGPADATLENCWRKYGMAITAGTGGSTWMQPYDQEDAGPAPATPISWTYDTGLYTVENHCPYHGKVMGSDQTVSAKAEALGWDPAVWDFSTGLPTLR